MLTSIEISRRILGMSLLSAGRSNLRIIREVKAKVFTKNGRTDGKMHRMAHCRYTFTGKNATVDYNYAKNKAKFGGLQTCASVWSCPVCSPIIQFQRKEDLQCVSQLMEEDYYIVMWTVTMSHSMSDYLLHLVKGLNKSFGQLRRGKRWDNLRSKIGYQFDVVATEATFGFPSGWHPHKHVLAFCLKKTVDALKIPHPELPFATLYGAEAMQYLLRSYIDDRWLTVLDNNGLFAVSDGQDVTISDRKISDYIAKFGHLPYSWGVEDELARGSSKIGKSMPESHRYTPMELLRNYTLKIDDLYFDHEEAMERWLDFTLVMKGRRQLRYSKGFKKYLKENGIDLLTDDQIVELDDLDPSYEPLMRLDWEQWQYMQREEIVPFLLDYVEAVNGDPALIIQWLREKGVKI